MHAGSCLCGGVSYRIDGPLGDLVLCHCSRCRKANGSAFQAVSPIATADFVLLSGADLLSEYSSSPGVHRVYCRVCHAPLYSRRDAAPDMLRLRVGTLDTPVDAPVRMHIFTASRAEWYEIRDPAPQHPDRPGE
ncbi:GFA family protein [Pseudoxanthomonas mexicana]|uniref:GFA family protein n=1 Tax=Pseudoxanthomonas mexicana TaxID=128785 RepID=UPI00398B1109